ncbi:MAG: hypothetical protein FJ115_17950 [Deltaproteobacteria bacterium]|nr:hypothetical protein [Deltaproteobacteria bacterium]
MFFKKKKFAREGDRIWATSELKWNGMVDEMIKEQNQYLLILTTAHFQKTLIEMRQQFQRKNLNFKDYDQSFSFHMGEWKEERAPILLIMAEKLSELDTCIQQLGEPEIKNGEVLMIAAEHHPLKEEDEVLFSFMSRLPCRSRIRFHCALDEPLFKLFGGERVVSLLKSLGWNEKDHISHSVISSAIEKAQEKVKQKARGNQRVDSIEDWFRYNATPPP